MNSEDVGSVSKDQNPYARDERLRANTQPSPEGSVRDQARAALERDSQQLLQQRLAKENEQQRNSMAIDVKQMHNTETAI